MKSLSRVRLLATPWTAAYQAPLSMGFSRQEYWSGLPLPSLDLKLYFNEKSISDCLSFIIEIKYNTKAHFQFFDHAFVYLLFLPFLDIYQFIMLFQPGGILY